jgi:hypothetical protein
VPVESTVPSAADTDKNVTPLPPLPEMTLPAPAAEPPMRALVARTSTPELVFGRASDPSALTPT